MRTSSSRSVAERHANFAGSGGGSASGSLTAPPAPYRSAVHADSTPIVRPALPVVETANATRPGPPSPSPTPERRPARRPARAPGCATPHPPGRAPSPHRPAAALAPRVRPLFRLAAVGADSPEYLPHNGRAVRVVIDLARPSERTASESISGKSRFCLVIHVSEPGARVRPGAPLETGGGTPCTTVYSAARSSTAFSGAASPHAVRIVHEPPVRPAIRGSSHRIHTHSAGSFTLLGGAHNHSGLRGGNQSERVSAQARIGKREGGRFIRPPSGRRRSLKPGFGERISCGSPNRDDFRNQRVRRSARGRGDRSRSPARPTGRRPLQPRILKRTVRGDGKTAPIGKRSRQPTKRRPFLLSRDRWPRRRDSACVRRGVPRRLRVGDGRAQAR